MKKIGGIDGKASRTSLSLSERGLPVGQDLGPLGIPIGRLSHASGAEVMGDLVMCEYGADHGATKFCGILPLTA